MRSLQLFLLACALATAAHARPFMVVAYNVENLFDLDGVASYDDYQPSKYTRAHALTKLQNIARVVARFEGGRGPDVLILNELEVDSTPGKNPPDYDAILTRYAGMRLDEMLGAKFNSEIGDLPAEALLAKALGDAGITGYRIVIGDSTPAPGERKQEIKNAVFTRFPVKHTRSHATPGARAILEVAVEIDGAPLYLFANHWKSGASDAATEATRAGNARTLRTRLDEILRNDPNADIVVGGDLNSQYNQKQRYTKMKTTGINDVLGSQGNELAVRGTQRDVYNLWFELPPAERGSDTYRGEWGTLMHLIIARGLYDFRGVQYVDNSFAVGKFIGLNADDKGEPVRWAFDGPAGHGFSDHFPVSAKFVTVTDNRADKYLPLRNASAERASDAAAAVKIDYTKIDLEKVAVSPAKLPAGTNLRADPFKGKIVRVDGKVAKGTRLAVEFAGETYDVFSFDQAFLKKLRADYQVGDTLKFYGEIGQYRERWQFIIRDPSWVK
jgi:endonuclease/exonuclease/phosphatase family metal-dependent hydrolase